MRIAVAADERVGIAGVLVQALVARGHEVSVHGALAQPTRGGGEPTRSDGERRRGEGGQARAEEESARGEDRLAGSDAGGREEQWAWCAEAAGRAVVEGRAAQAVVCCWTGTGASIAANKVAGIRAALCADAATAAGARRWNDANVLALSLRSTSEAELQEILDAWFAGAASEEAEDRMNVAHLADIELRGSPPGWAENG